VSHHVSAGSSNPTGAVEVVRVQNSAATRAPVDSGGAAKPAVTDVAGNSGRPGANLPVAEIEQASNTIQNGRADLTRTAGAERRLDGFDGVGGGGGGGGAGGANANANNATGAPAQGTAQKDVSKTGVGGIQKLGNADLDTRAPGTERG
jgi:hypothetical protein